jgi:predicted acetyltransferase
MPEPQITFARADVNRKDEIYEYALEFREAGDERYKPALDDPDAYLERIEMLAEGRDLPEGKVRMWLFWLERDGRIVAESSLRHELNDYLRHEGGHIGYNVRPSERMKGYGSVILGLMLGEARKIGLTRVLLTCDADNAGSYKIIEKHGGVLESEGVSENSGKTVRRYWIEI